MNRPTIEITPLLESLLSIVRDTCAPAATDWQQALIQRLYAEFYAPPEPGKQILAEDEMKRHMRLLAVENRLSARKTPPSTDGAASWKTWID